MLDAILNAIGKYSWRAMLGVFIATGVMLFFACRLGIYDWVEQFRGLLIFGFIVSGGVLLSYIGSAIYPHIKGVVHTSWSKHLAKEHLKHMTDDEKIVCQWFVDHNGQSYRTDPAEGPVSMLEAAGIIFRPGTAHQGGVLYDYQIHPWILDFLREHSGMLSLSTGH